MYQRPKVVASQQALNKNAVDGLHLDWLTWAVEESEQQIRAEVERKGWTLREDTVSVLVRVEAIAESKGGSST